MGVGRGITQAEDYVGNFSCVYFLLAECRDGGGFGGAGGGVRAYFFSPISIS